MRVLVPADYTPLDVPLPPRLPEALGGVTCGLAVFWVSDDGTALWVEDEGQKAREGSIDAWEAWTGHAATRGRIPAEVLRGEAALVLAAASPKDMMAWAAPLASARSWLRAHAARHRHVHVRASEPAPPQTSAATLNDPYLEEIEKIRREQRLILELEEWLDRQRNVPR